LGIISPRPLKRWISTLERGGRACDDALSRSPRLVGGPPGLLAGVDAVERRLGQVDVAAVDQRGQVAVEEGEQQRGDVVAVAVGVHQQDDALVAQRSRVEVLAHAAAQRLHDVGARCSAAPW
jgi:hypothetical protein